ncbi:MAG: hypothetical protein OXG24_01240 [Gammaproteobacteria bacterium]|nr:hypothetical protein [Gammaproteobacteria bacterium]
MEFLLAPIQQQDVQRVNARNAMAVIVDRYNVHVVPWSLRSHSRLHGLDSRFKKSSDDSIETSYPFVGWRDIASLIEVTLINLVHPCQVSQLR